MTVNESQLSRLSKRLDEGYKSHHLTSVDEIHVYQKHYFEALDFAVSCIRDRMDQPVYALYAKLENLLIKTIKWSDL